jgi:hypothetical protein
MSKLKASIVIVATFAIALLGLVTWQQMDDDNRPAQGAVLLSHETHGPVIIRLTPSTEDGSPGTFWSLRNDIRDTIAFQQHDRNGCSIQPDRDRSIVGLFQTYIAIDLLTPVGRNHDFGQIYFNGHGENLENLDNPWYRHPEPEVWYITIQPRDGGEYVGDPHRGTSGGYIVDFIDIEEPGTATFDDDRNLYVGDSEAPVIHAYEPDEDGELEDPVYLVGPEGDDEAQATVDDVERIAAIVVDDTRLSFIGIVDGQNHLYTLDEGATEARRVEPDLPVLGRLPDHIDLGHIPEGWRIRHRSTAAMDPLSYGRDPDTVLTTGLGPDDHPVISLVHLDTGNVEILAELKDVEPHANEPITAALAGDDLFFTAESALWRLNLNDNTDEGSLDEPLAENCDNPFD